MPFLSVDGLSAGHVWLAAYREYFYIPPGIATVRFASSSAASLLTVYDPTGAVVAGQPVALGNGVYEVQNVTPGTWALNVKGATQLRFLNIPQLLSFAPGTAATPADSPPYPCSTNADCPTGEVCGNNNGDRFGKSSGADVCWPPSCASSSPPSALCGSVLSPCGLCNL